jgi:leader peptidase (prepilin peptidase)/N-methyltransferase
VSAAPAVSSARPAFRLAERWGTAWRHPLSVIGMALAAAAALAAYGITADGFTMAFFFAVLVVLSIIDLERRVLPNAIVLPSAVLVFAVQVVLHPSHAAEWPLAAAGAGGLLFVLFLINPAGMGMGDVKLALLLGVALGAQVVPAFLIASVSVWPVAIYMVVRRGTAARRTAIAFGPFLAFGALVAALLGAPGS